MKSNALGVVVVRLQVPELHAGHHYLLNAVTTIHERVLVVIGITEARLTTDDPLTFEMRAAMLKRAYPNVYIIGHKDQPSDELWSRSLDLLIKSTDGEMFEEEPILYGGRDSFLSHYHGVYRTFELPPTQYVSGTNVRKAVTTKDSIDFREGMIFASKHRWPTSYQCVDVAVFNGTGEKLLLGQKKSDNGKWRFIGGFVDPTDASLEAAAKREVREEIGVEPGDAIYIGSTQINDFRYPKEGRDRLMSALFVMQYSFGAPRAADDLDDCRWTTVNQAQYELVPEHMPLYHILRNYYHGGSNA